MAVAFLGEYSGGDEVFGGEWVCVSVSEFRHFDSGYDCGSQPDAGIYAGRPQAGELAFAGWLAFASSIAPCGTSGEAGKAGWMGGDWEPDAGDAGSNSLHGFHLL